MQLKQRKGTTMMKSTTIRMDDELKREASMRLESLGLNFNTYVVMATRQLVAQNRVPFDLVVPADYERFKVTAEEQGNNL